MQQGKKGIKGFQKTDDKTHKSKRVSFLLDEREYVELMLYLDAKQEPYSKILRELVMNVVRSEKSAL
tara:strand:- start:485 stop:685 length:201 start_codon:yes stop_codon:yes gene_type:complete